MLGGPSEQSPGVVVITQHCSACGYTESLTVQSQPKQVHAPETSEGE